MASIRRRAAASRCRAMTLTPGAVDNTHGNYFDKHYHVLARLIRYTDSEVPMCFMSLRWAY